MMILCGLFPVFSPFICTFFPQYCWVWLHFSMHIVLRDHEIAGRVFFSLYFREFGQSDCFADETIVAFVTRFEACVIANFVQLFFVFVWYSHRGSKNLIGIHNNWSDQSGSKHMKFNLCIYWPALHACQSRWPFIWMDHSTMYFYWEKFDNFIKNKGIDTLFSGRKESPRKPLNSLKWRNKTFYMNFKWENLHSLTHARTDTAALGSQIMQLFIRTK